MREEFVLHTEIDRCPACAGAWLDAGELTLLSEASRRGGIGDAFLVHAFSRL